jgi:hypothetical protein
LVRCQRPLPFADFARRSENLFRLREPVDVRRDDSFIASGFEIEQPGGLIERRQVLSRGVDPCFMGDNHRRDLIAFAAEGGCHGKTRTE